MPSNQQPPKSGDGSPANIPQPIVPPHVRLAEAAQALGLKRKTLHEWSSAGDPRFFLLRPWKNLAGQWRFPVEAIQECQRRAPTAVGLARPGLRRTWLVPRTSDPSTRAVDRDHPREEAQTSAASTSELVTEAEIADSIPLKEAAERLGVAAGILRYHVGKGRIPQLRTFLDGRGPLRVPPDAVDGARPTLERVLAEAAPYAARIAAAKARKAAERQQRRDERRKRREAQ